MGWNRAVSHRWLKSPNGLDQRAWASTARFTYRPSIAPPPPRESTAGLVGPDVNAASQIGPLGGPPGSVRLRRMSTEPGAAPPMIRHDPEAGRPDWRRVVIVFWITSMVEGLGVSQVFAYL